MATPMEERESEIAEEKSVELERTKVRCKAIIDRIQSLIHPSKKKKKKESSFYETLLRLAQSELSFLSRSSNFSPLSSNLGHIEAVLYILQQPFVKGVSRVCKTIPVSGLLGNEQKCTSKIHVDILCTVNGKPVWFLVSARNPKYVVWNGPCEGKNKSLRTRILQVVDAAARSPAATKPFSIFLFFLNGLTDGVSQKLEVEFKASKFNLDITDSDILSGELDGDWVFVSRPYQHACVYEIKVDCPLNTIGSDECEVKGSLVSNISTKDTFQEENMLSNISHSFCQLISGMRFDRREDLSSEGDLINFDTTALIALVSGISNGDAKKLLAESESELRQRFKGGLEFITAQVMSEIQKPIHADLDHILSGKKGMICGSVVSEFKQLVSMCGGANEKSRAAYLLSYLYSVPDTPSVRVMSLPTTRKLALKNKVVFGTGDYWKAPTLTSNMAFVRAVSQTGMSLFTVEHSPCALIGD